MSAGTPPSKILSALYRELGWGFNQNNHESLSYVKFRDILMDQLELIGSERTTKEKWKNLIDFGYFTKVNQHSCIVDLTKIKSKLGLPTQEEEDAYDMQQSGGSN